MNILEIPEGSMVTIGRPRQPMAASEIEALRMRLRGIAGIGEAHLPQLFAMGCMEAPAQVLVLILSDGALPEVVVDCVKAALDRAPALGEALAVYPMAPDNPSVAGVRQADCKLPLAGPS